MILFGASDGNFLVYFKTSISQQHLLFIKLSLCKICVFFKPISTIVIINQDCVNKIRRETTDKNFGCSAIVVDKREQWA